MIRKVGAESVLSDVEKSIYSYNNVITNLNAKCASIVENTNSDILDVRCVGSNPVSKNSENSTMFTSTFLANNPSSHATYSAGAFNGKGKGTDNNFIEDYDRLVLIGANASENSEGYWLASRFVDEGSGSVYFYVRGVRSDGEDGGSYIWYVDTDNVSGYYSSRGVRPVVSLSSSVLSNYLD